MQVAGVLHMSDRVMGWIWCFQEMSQAGCFHLWQCISTLANLLEVEAQVCIGKVLLLTHFQPGGLANENRRCIVMDAAVSVLVCSSDCLSRHDNFTYVYGLTYVYGMARF